MSLQLVFTQGVIKNFAKVEGSGRGKISSGRPHLSSSGRVGQTERREPSLPPLATMSLSLFFYPNSVGLIPGRVASAGIPLRRTRLLGCPRHSHVYRGNHKKTSRGESVRFVSSPSAQNQPVWVAVKSHTPGEKSTNMLEGRPYLITAYNRKRSTQVCVLMQLMGTPEGRRGLLQTRTFPGSPVRLNLRPSRL